MQQNTWCRRGECISVTPGQMTVEEKHLKIFCSLAQVRISYTLKPIICSVELGCDVTNLRHLVTRSPESLVTRSPESLGYHVLNK